MRNSGTLDVCGSALRRRFYFHDLAARIVLLATLIFFLQSSAVIAKAPVPEADAEARARKLVAEVYKADYVAAKDAADKVALAKKLLIDAQQTKEDLAAQFVMNKIAIDIATKEGDFKTALSGAFALEENFDFDASSLRIDVLSKISRVPKPVENQGEFIQEMRILIKNAVAEDRYDEATAISAIAVPAARIAKNADLVRLLSAEAREIAEMQKVFKASQVAMETLAATPKDPAANLAVGKYKCFYKQDWDNGLLYLALGGDDQLALQAKQDILASKSKVDQLAIADAWWKTAESCDGIQATHVKSRAFFWYRSALPQLQGLDRSRVERKLAGVDASDAPPMAIDSEPESPDSIFKVKSEKVPIFDGATLNGWHVERGEWIVRNKCILNLETGEYSRAIYKHPIPGTFSLSADLAFPSIPRGISNKGITIFDSAGEKIEIYVNPERDSVNLTVPYLEKGFEKPTRMGHSIRIEMKAEAWYHIDATISGTKTQLRVNGDKMVDDNVVFKPPYRLELIVQRSGAAFRDLTVEVIGK